MAFYGCFRDYFYDGCRDFCFIYRFLELFEPLQQLIIILKLRVFEASVRVTVVFEFFSFDKVIMVICAFLRHYCKS